MGWRILVVVVALLGHVALADSRLELAHPIDFVAKTARLAKGADRAVAAVAQTLKDDPAIAVVEIGAHVDNTGTAAAAKKLTQARADAVRTALIGLGVDAARLTAKGYGFDKPLVPNDTPAHRAENRRIEISVVKRLEAAAPEADPDKPLAVGDAAPELAVLVDAAGAPAKLAAYRGSWVVVTFSATWCNVCMKGVAAWDKLAVERAGKPAFVVVDVTDPDQQAPKQIRAAYAKLGLAATTVLSAHPDKNPTLTRYAGQLVPVVFVIDPTGIIRYRGDGFRHTEVDAEVAKLRDAVAKLVK